MSQTLESPAALFFREHFLHWVVGKLDPAVEEELDALTPPGMENWKRVMQRLCPWSCAELRERFQVLSELMADEEALEILLREVGA